MIGYLKEFDESKTMSLRVYDSKFFKKYCKIWRTISLLGIEFDSKPEFDSKHFVYVFVFDYVRFYC